MKKLYLVILILVLATGVSISTVNGQSLPPPQGEELPPPPPPPPPSVPDEVEIVEIVEKVVEPGETVSTGIPEKVSEEKPAVVAVTTSKGGTVVIVQTTVVEKITPPPQGFRFLGRQFIIEAPSASPEEPLVLVFTLHQSLLLSTDTNIEDIQVFRDGVVVDDCTSSIGTAEPNPCVASKFLEEDGFQFKVLTSEASTWNFGQREEGKGFPIILIVGAVVGILAVLLIGGWLYYRRSHKHS